MSLKRNKLLTGALILTLTGFILRGLGMALRVLMSSRLGEEGMGLYQLTQSVYFLFITVAQSGISVALTRIMSARLALGDEEGAQSVMTASLRASLILGVLSAAAMTLLSHPICMFFIGDMRCLNPIISLSWALPSIAVCGVISAYFIVHGSTVYGCISQLIEQILRIGFVLLLPSLTLTTVTLSGTVAETLSCIFLVICYIKKRKKRGRGRYVRELVKTAAPVAASRLLASALHSAENVLVPNAVAVFTLDRALALSQFGALKGMALPLIFFPYSLLNAVTTLLVPKVSGSQAKNDVAALGHTVGRVCTVTIALSVMAAGAFYTFAEPLGQVIYGSKRVSYMISRLAPILPFMYLDSVCDGFLKGLGKQNTVLLHGSIDSCLRLVLSVIFVPRFGIDAFLGVMVISNVSLSLMNYRTLCSAAFIKPRLIMRFLPPVLLTTLSSILTKFLFKISASAINLAVGGLLFCVIFALFYLLFGAIVKKSEN